MLDLENVPGVQYEDMGQTVVTVEETVKVLGGDALPVTMTRRKGLCRYIDHGAEKLADEALFCDYGKKMGIARSYILHKETQAPPEVRARNRAQVQEIIIRAMQLQGIW